MSNDNETIEAEEVPLELNAEPFLEKIIQVTVCTPMGDPNDHQCKMGAPTCFWGLSGIGKSDRTEAASSSVQLVCETLFPSTNAPEDFAGAPMPLNGDLVRRCVLDEVKRLNEIGKGVIFIDEASDIPPAVQAAMMGVLLKRSIGPVKLVPGIRFLLAANPPEYAANGFSLAAPFANRMLHFNISPPPVKNWLKWYIDEASVELEDIDSASKRVTQLWPIHYPAVKQIFAGYLDSKGDDTLHNQPKPHNPKSGRAWPSPRMWTVAGRVVATARCLGMPKEIEEIMVTGCVGEKYAAEWVAYALEADLPSPHDVLTKGWQPDTQRLDRSYAVSSGITSYVVGIQDRDEKLKMAALAWERFYEFHKAGLTDTAAPAVDVLIKKGLGYKSKDPGIMKASKPLLKVINNEGLVDLMDKIQT